MCLSQKVRTASSLIQHIRYKVMIVLTLSSLLNGWRYIQTIKYSTENLDSRYCKPANRKRFSALCKFLVNQIDEGIQQTLLPIRQAIELAASKYEIQVQWDSNNRQVILYTSLTAPPISNHFIGAKKKYPITTLASKLRSCRQSYRESCESTRYRYNRTEAWSNTIGTNKNSTHSN